MDDDFGDGWGEDLDDLIDDDDLGGQPAPTPAPAPAPIPAAPVPAPAPVGNVGWGDEDEGWGDDLDDLEVEPDGPHKAATSDKQGWGDDDDLFQDSQEIEAPPAVNTPVAPPRQNQQLDKVHQELVSYVESLMVLLPSINAVLSAEYNLPEKAADLLHYYSERPQLREYTIEKELSRMEYQVVIQHDSGTEPIVVKDKDEIAKLFRLQNELDMLVRCANQSLLADLLHVMTGPDGLVRPQYMATCLAESCMFVLRCKPGAPGGLVECFSRLVLSLPEPSGNRYPVANLKVHIMLGIPTHPGQPPMVDFKLKNLDIVIDSMDVLRPTAQFLLESGLLDDPCMSPFPDSPAGAGPIDDNDRFRDVFLQQSQNMLQNSTVGLKSAWKQIDSVAGIQNKMNMVKNILPTNDTFEAAMQEQEAYQQQLQAQRQYPGAIQPNDTVPVSYPPSSSRPQPPIPPPQPQARPTSILGSFMGAIAKTVTLPEEDATMYDHYAAGLQKPNGGNQPQTAFPRPPAAFPRPLETAGAAAQPMRLYRTAESTAAAPEPAPAKKVSPWLNRLTEPEAPAPVPASVTSFPRPPAAESSKSDENNALEGDDDDLGLDDGWGEEDDGFVIDDGLATPAAAVQASAPVPHPTPTTTSTPVVASAAAKKQETFSIEDDVVEIRKRWVNPRSGPRYLTTLLS